MRKAAMWALVLAFGLGAGAVGRAQTAAETELAQLKKTVEEQRKQIGELQIELAKLKAGSTATTKNAANKPAGALPIALEKRTAAVTKSMERVIAEMAFDPISLADLPGKLKTQYGLEAEIDTKALEKAGISENVPLAVNVRQAKLSDALRTLLASSGGPGKKLDYEVAEGVVKITTREVIDNAISKQVYDVRDVIDYEMKLNRVDRPDAVQQLTRMINSLVAPESWRDTGGAIGTLREEGGQLTITQTKKGHQQINELLKQLREKGLKR